MSDSQFPLGAPINRPAPTPVWEPIPNRPGWRRNRETGKEVYTEPPRPSPEPGWPFPTGTT